MRPILLTKLIRDAVDPQPVYDHAADTDDVGENVGPLRMTEGQAQQTTPCIVNADTIRCFYTRKGGRPGTRITFSDGGGFVVTEDFDTVSSKVQPN